MTQTQELGEIAGALNILARHGLLFGGSKRKQRRIVEVRATSTQFVVRYEDGGVYYIDQRLKRRFIVYTHPPPPK